MAWAGVALAGLAASQIPGLWALAGISLVPIALGFYRLELLQTRADEDLKAQAADLSNRYDTLHQRYHQMHITHCKKIASEMMAPIDSFESAIRSNSGDLLGALGTFRQAITAATAISDSRAGVDIPREALLVHRYLEGLSSSWMSRFEDAEIEFELDLSRSLPEGIFINRPTLDLIMDHIFHAVLRRGQDGEVFLHATFGKDGLTLAFADDARGLGPGDPIVCERTEIAQRLAIAIKGKGRTGGDLERGVETRITLPASVFEAQGIAAPYDDSIYLRPGLDLAERKSLIEPGVIDLTEELHGYVESRPAIRAKREAERLARRAARKRAREAAGDAVSATSESFRQDGRLPTQPMTPIPRNKTVATGARLLFAEDLIVNQTVFISQAESIGAKAICVGTAEAALEALHAAVFDIAVMDLHMPGMGGVEGIRQIRATMGTAFPVIAYTADTDPVTHESARLAGADLVLTKPASEAELSAAIRQCLQKSHAA